MHCLIYYSSSAYLFSTEDLRDILVKSRTNNVKLGITGLLLYHDGGIMQILEGEEDDINSLFNKISKDDRHSRVLKMLDSPIENRSFNGWSMGFKQISGDDWNRLDGYLNVKDKENVFSKIQVENQAIITLVKSFVRVNFKYV